MANTIESRIQMGDEQSFELLYRRYFVRLCAFANKFLNDPFAAEEVVQDTFLKIWENRITLRNELSGKSFLFQTVHNKSLNLLAHQNVVNRYSELIRTAYANPEDFDVHESLMAKELNLQIQKIVNDLPPECRKIFVMSRAEGKKIPEIAQQLNLSVNTVETQLTRALKKLRTALSEYMAILLINFFLNL